MVDLKSQYKNIKTEIDTAIQEVIENAAFIKGTQIKVFENNLAKYLNVNHVISCANGTDALQIAMMALNLKHGDEILIPNFTYVATAEAIALLGLTPVFIDVEPETFCIDTQIIESKITNKTKAIVPVHLFGQCVNMNEIMQIANKHNLFVIEDTAQAIGAKYKTGNTQLTKNAGTIGNIGTISFFPSKNLGCYGDGGALITNDDELAKKIRMICNHGQSIQYTHEIIGVNSRLDTIQAAILNAKLPHLTRYENARNEVANWYDELLGNHNKIIIPKRNPESTHVFHQYTIQLKNEEVLSMNDEKMNAKKFNSHDSFRDFVRKQLAELNIPTMVYYPIELHKQKAFEKFNTNNDHFPVSEMLCKTVLSLPIHTEMNKKMVEFIANSLLHIINN